MVVTVVCVVLAFWFSGLVTFGCYFPGDLLWLAFACTSALYLIYCLFWTLAAVLSWLRFDWVGGCTWVLFGFLPLVCFVVFGFGCSLF